MGALEVRDLVKRLGGNTVVDRVSFTVPDGEFFVLVGASGSGKSTLLRLICGLEQPDSGQILLDGRDVTGLPARERNLGMVFQDYGLYPNMDVFQNIAYGLEARGMPRQEIEQRVTQAAGMLGLGELLRRPIGELSGGEQQRVALARALAKDASAYLFDEPLSNLDPKLRHQARRDITALHRAKRKPSIYVTHDQTEALAMADRIAVLAHGQLQQVGTPEDLLHAPENMYVARFIGSPPMNLVWGQAEPQGGGFTFRADGLALPLPERWSTALRGRADQRVVLGFRPDALLAGGQPSPYEQTAPISGTVTDVEALVGEMVVTLRVGEQVELAALFTDDGLAEPEIGQPLEVRLSLDGIRLFDPDSERALAG